MLAANEARHEEAESAALPLGPVVDDDGITFRFCDVDRTATAVRLCQGIGIPPEAVEFTRAADDLDTLPLWTLRVPASGAARIEYLLEVRRSDGRTETVLDPGNPLTAPGVFGDKSVAESADYVMPGWLDGPAPSPGLASEVIVEADDLPEAVRGMLWAPDGVDADDAALPLLVVHDGPEYDEFAALTRYLSWLRVPLRALLLNPGSDRNARYGAEDAYAATLVASVLPLVPAARRIGVGTSLGALSMLHAHRRHPGTFDTLFLQSGSFFTRELDPQEQGANRFDEVAAFVRETHEAETDVAPIRIVMTCGAVEENLANNRLMAATLRRLGYDVTLHENRDAHNYTAWRDALHPHLADVVRAA
jgi:enterochelin esterase-like enzyme